ncbi:MAG: T9SS type A sorting domain-containing protein [Lewinella sp.]|nr:T9SS type A sorting domain-containing protein [Lewinella sp.]
MKPIYLLKLTVVACLLAVFTGCDTSQDDRTTFSTTEMDREKRENPVARMEAEFNMLKNPTTGLIPRGVREAEMKAAYTTPAFPMSLVEPGKTLPAITITSKGPDNYGGRTRAIGFDVRNTTASTGVIISGGVSGGIFRSTDGGGSWIRVTPAGEIHNLTTVAQDPRTGNQDTWYAGTGEQVGNSTSGGGATYLGYGILKSTDNGASWSPLASTRAGNQVIFDNDFDYIGKILVNPTNGDVLASVGEAVLRSDDGGANWSAVLGSASTFGRFGDLIYNSPSSTFYASINGADANGGIHSSADGISWTQVRTGAQLDANGVGRIVLTNLGNTPNIAAFFQLNVTFSCTNSGDSGAGLQVLVSGVWNNLTDKVGNCNTGSAPTKVLELQGGYNMCMVGKPNDANYIYFGGTEIYRYNISTEVYDFIGGSQQGANTINLHVDNHILIFDPTNDDIMWSGNDGGLRSTDVTGTIKTASGDDNGYDWSSKNNGYVTYQYYSADINPVNGSEFVAGAAQDNAFTIQPTTAAGLEVGPTVDGTSVAIISGTSFANYSILTAWQFGGLMRIDDGVQTYITPTGKDQGFLSRIYLDADNTQLLYYPTTGGNLLRTTSASGITNGTITGDASTGWEDMTGVVAGSAISTFETTRSAAGAANGSYSASDAARKLYFGTVGGKVFRLSDPAYGSASAAPVEITPGAGFVSDISVNPEDDKEVMVTYSNYSVSSVWHTTDASVASPAWTEVEGPGASAVALASVRSALMVRVGTQTIYLVGTSTGLYATDVLSGATTTWERVGSVTGTPGPNDIGYAVGSFMRLRPSDNQAVLGTHGNGLFMLGFPASALPVEFLSFNGTPTGKGNMLNWTTTEEVDNSGFDVERSDDGRRFEQVAFVPANQSRFSEHNYAYFDAPLTSEVTYYRLKQIDLDGTFGYSEIISVRNGTDLETGTSIFPNPVVNHLTVVNGEGEAIIFNAAGQQITQVTITTEKQDIDVSGLPQGTYVLRIKQLSGELIARKFVK